MKTRCLPFLALFITSFAIADEPAGRKDFGLAIYDDSFSCGSKITAFAPDSDAAKFLQRGDYYSVEKLNGKDVRKVPPAELKARLAALEGPIAMVVITTDAHTGWQKYKAIKMELTRAVTHWVIPWDTESNGQTAAIEARQHCVFDPGWALELDEVTCHMLLTEPGDRTAAADAKLQSGDEILRLGNIDFTDLNRAAGQLPVKEADGKVTVQILRKGVPLALKMPYKPLPPGGGAHGPTGNDAIASAGRSTALGFGRCRGENAKLSLADYVAKAKRERDTREQRNLEQLRKQEAEEAARWWAARGGRQEISHSANGSESRGEGYIGAPGDTWANRTRMGHEGNWVMAEGDQLYQLSFEGRGMLKDARGNLTQPTSGFVSINPSELMPCPSCRAKGEYLSTAWGLTKPCHACRGLGTIGGGGGYSMTQQVEKKIEGSGGPGIRPTYYTTTEEHQVVSGSGGITCPVCNGRGYFGTTITCSRCQGWGQVVRPEVIDYLVQLHDRAPR